MLISNEDLVDFMCALELKCVSLSIPGFMGVRIDAIADNPDVFLSRKHEFQRSSSVLLAVLVEGNNGLFALLVGSVENAD